MRLPSPTPLLLLLLLACGGAPTSPDAEGPSSLVVGPEDLVVVTQGSIASGPRISGTLEAASQAEMRAETGGQVLEVLVELGQAVEKGQRLARIEGSVARDTLSSAAAGITAAEQDLAMARREHERVARLIEAGALATRDQENAESMILAAQARVEQARAQVAMARDQVAATTVLAPMQGVVSVRAVNQGDIVSPGSPMFTVIDPSSLRLEGSVPADALSLLSVGTVVRFQVQGVADREFAGTVERIAPSVDAVTRQIPILVTVPNPEGQIVAGLFAEGRVASHIVEGLVVPADAVLQSAGKSSVVRVVDGRAQVVPVELGVRNEELEQVEVKGGIQAGDRILLGAAKDVADGTPVEVRQAPAPGAGG